jgi:hypothetical protein
MLVLTILHSTVCVHVNNYLKISEIIIPRKLIFLQECTYVWPLKICSHGRAEMIPKNSVLVNEPFGSIQFGTVRYKRKKVHYSLFSARMAMTGRDWSIINKI